MVRTRVGYAGGTSSNPTYRNLDGHTETIQIDYDPSVISYGELLDIFWDSHDPTSQSWSTQYRNIIFYHDEKQKKIAEESMSRLSSEINDEIDTDLRPFTGFYLAEDYHQKHNLRFYPGIMQEFKAVYPDIRDLIASTAVTKANGYLGGHGTCDQLRTEIDMMGLSESGSRVMITTVCGGNIESFCSTEQCRGRKLFFKCSIV